MDTPEAKWLGIASFVQAARHRLGDAAWRDVEARLPPDTRKLLAAPPSALAWVDAEHVFAIQDALVAHAGGRTEVLRELARVQIDGDLRGIYRLFVRLASPDFIAQRAATLYKSYWRGFGALHVERSGERAFDIVYEGIPTVRLSWVASQLGAIQAALEVSGQKSVRVNIVQTSDHGVRARASWA